MKIIVQVTRAELRGVPFDDYAAALESLLGEIHRPDVVKVVRGTRAAVAIDGHSTTPDARELLGLVKEITRPEVIDLYFGWPLPAAWRDDYVRQHGDPGKAQLCSGSFWPSPTRGEWITPPSATDIPPLTPT